MCDYVLCRVLLVIVVTGWLLSASSPENPPPPPSPPLASHPLRPFLPVGLWPLVVVVIFLRRFRLQCRWVKERTRQVVALLVRNTAAQGSREVMPKYSRADWPISMDRVSSSVAGYSYYISVQYCYNYQYSVVPVVGRITCHPRPLVRIRSSRDGAKDVMTLVLFNQLFSRNWKFLVFPNLHPLSSYFYYCCCCCFVT